MKLINLSRLHIMSHIYEHNKDIIRAEIKEVEGTDNVLEVRKSERECLEGNVHWHINEDNELENSKECIVEKECANMYAFESLIGAKLVELTDKGFTVSKRNDDITEMNKLVYGDDHEDYIEEFKFEFFEDSGVYGYNKINTQLFIDPNEMPVITKVEMLKEATPRKAKCQVTFFGLDKAIAEINTTSGSSSEWKYGAYVKVEGYFTGKNTVTLSEW